MNRRDIEQLNDIFNEWDFLNVVSDGIRNEYNDLVVSTLKFLEGGIDATALSMLLSKIITDRYGIVMKPSDKGLIEASKKIVAWENKPESKTKHSSIKQRRPRFNSDLAAKIVGKHVLIGYTHYKIDGSIDKLIQKHGVVTKADKKDGVAVRLNSSDEILWLPPDLRSWTLAPLGTYRLASTGEVITNPDYLVTWTVNLAK